MNCCNEYGDCRQGRDCPARKQRTDLPRIEFAGPEPEPMWLRVCNWIGYAIGFALVISLGFAGVKAFACDTVLDKPVYVEKSK